MVEYFKKVYSILICLLLTSIVCFFIGEITIRIFYNNFSNYNMEMWRYAAELKEPLPSQKLPFQHYVNMSGHFYGVDIKINSLGFRDFEYPKEKPPNKKRIIFIGDSFTLGWGVPLNRTFAKQVEQMLNKTDHIYEVINMGIGNYNSMMEVELFKLKGLPLKPDLLIMSYFINDAEPTPKRTIFSRGLLKYSYFLNFCFDRYVKLRIRFDEEFKWETYYQQLYDENSKSLAMNKSSIKELSKICKDARIQLLIVNIPELHELKEYPFSFATEYVRNIAVENHLPFLDMLPFLKNYNPESLWVTPEDTHANVKAHTIIAQEIYQKIREEYLL